MLSKILEVSAWSTLVACVTCMAASLYVVVFYQKYATWYTLRNRTAPTRKGAFWRYIGWAFILLMATIALLLGAYKSLPHSPAT